LDVHHRRLCGWRRLLSFLASTPLKTIKLRIQCLSPGVYHGPMDCFLQTIRKEVELASCTHVQKKKKKKKK
jgi:hypothetical protein